MQGMKTLFLDDIDDSYWAKVDLTYEKENTDSILTKFVIYRKYTEYEGDNVSNEKVELAFDGNFSFEDYLVIYAKQEGPSEKYYTRIIYKKNE